MDTPYEQLQKEFGDRIKVNEPLARYTTFKIGGPADYFYDAKTSEEFVAVVARAYALGVPVTILGGGTNVLIGDRGIRGLVVKNSAQSITIRGLKGSIGSGSSSGVVFVEADAGVPMNKLVRFTIEEGLAGLEMQLGLPGSVGGAVYMNSKWTHPTGYVGDAVYQATILDKNGEIKHVPHDYFRFGYDYSNLQQTKEYVVSVVFALRQDDKDRLWKTANESIAYRRETQPQGVFSAGCTFKNISKAEALAVSTPNLTTSAGFLVDHAGMKGARIGDAEISMLHANFIINKVHATASDVVKLIEKARSAVQNVYHVKLEEEIVRVGEF